MESHRIKRLRNTIFPTAEKEQPLSFCARLTRFAILTLMIPVRTNSNFTQASFSFFSPRCLLFVALYCGPTLVTATCLFYFSSAATEAAVALRTVHNMFDCVSINNFLELVRY